MRVNVFLLLLLSFISVSLIKGQLKVSETFSSCFINSYLPNTNTPAQLTFDVSFVVEKFPYKNVTTTGSPSPYPVIYYYGNYMIFGVSRIGPFTSGTPPTIQLFDTNNVSYPITFTQPCVGPEVSTNFARYNPSIVLFNKKTRDQSHLVFVSDISLQIDVMARSPGDFLDFYPYGTSPSSSIISMGKAFIIPTDLTYPFIGTNTINFKIDSIYQTRNFAMTTPFIDLSSNVPVLSAFKDHTLYESFEFNIVDSTGKAKMFSLTNESRLYEEGLLFPVYGYPSNAIYIGFKWYSGPSLIRTSDIVAVGYKNHTLKVISYTNPNKTLSSTFNSNTVTNSNEMIITFSTNLENSKFDFYEIRDPIDEADFGSEFNRKPWLSYPYGFSTGNFKNFTFTRSVFYSKYHSKYSFKTKVTKIVTLTKQTETVIPYVNNVEFFRMANGNTLVRQNLTVGNSGLAFSTLNGIKITSRDIVFRSDDDSQFKIYEKAFDTKSNLGFIEVIDNSGYDIRTKYPFSTPKITKKLDFDEITSIYFENQNVDLSTQGYWNTIYLNKSDADTDLKIPFKFYASKEKDYQDWDYLEWDYTLKLYKFKFWMPPRMFTGTVHYDIPIESSLGAKGTPFSLSALLPTAALNVVSTNADEMAPVVSVLNKFVNDVVGNNKTFGWKMKIHDPLNGLESGNITINSDIDYLGYKFTFGPCGSIDPYQGEYYFSITIDITKCRSQIFTIKELTLRDTSGHFSNSTATDGIINPFIYITDLTLLSIPITCQNDDGTDNEGPQILNFKTNVNTIDVTSSNDRNVTVYFETFDPSGISIRHNPYIYIEEFKNEPIGFRATRVKGYNDTFVAYKTVIQVPYNFGMLHGTQNGQAKIGISIFGATDIYMNVAGWTFEQLKNQTFNSILNVTTDSKDLVIESAEIITKYQKYLAVYGRNFGMDSSMISISIYRNDGTLETKFTSSQFNIFSNIYIEVIITFNLSEFTIKIEKEDVVKSTYVVSPPQTTFISPVYCTGFPADIEVDPDPIVTPSPTPSPTPPTKSCSSDCGASKGYGICATGTCACYYPHSGYDCESIAANYTVNSNQNDPSISVNTNDGIKFESILAVVELRELDSNSNQVASYDLKPDQWKLDSLKSNDIYKEIQYSYMLSTQTNITSTVQIYSQSYNVTFGNQIIHMQPSTIKFTFSLSTYPFSASTNYLQLVIMASFKSQDSLSSSCSLTDYISDSSTSEYLKIQIEDRSLYGRFIKYGIIDGRETSVTNTLLKDYKNTISKSDQSQLYIGLNIPQYKSTVQLDPDFSVLIETKSAADKENSICSQSDTKKLTNAQIAGIVVGGVVFLFIIGAITVFILSRKGNSSVAIKLRKIAGRG